MRPEEIRDLLRQRPFQPFRVHLVNGTIFEVHHPDFGIVRQSTLQLMLPPEQEKEREALIALRHILWIEIFISTTC